MTAPAVARPAVHPLPDAEKTALRLLKSSERHSFDPTVDVDWDAPLVDGLWFNPPEQSPLYGTALWEQMSEEQRVQLTKHEVASVAATGLWFEMILMQMLLRAAYDQDPTRRHTQYALTEIGDECRHSVMFGRLVERLGCPPYRRSRTVHELGRFFKATSDGPVTYAGALFAEEVLDALQRVAMDDERVQPLVRTVSRIHVVEEARHVRYAREESVRQWARLSRHRRLASGAYLSFVSAHILGALIAPGVYSAVGLDPAEARRQAAANEHWRETRRQAARKTLGFYEEIGALEGGRPLYRRLGLLD